MKKQNEMYWLIGRKVKGHLRTIDYLSIIGICIIGGFLAIIFFVERLFKRIKD